MNDLSIIILRFFAINVQISSKNSDFYWVFSLHLSQQPFYRFYLPALSCSKRKSIPIKAVVYENQNVSDSYNTGRFKN